MLDMSNVTMSCDVELVAVITSCGTTHESLVRTIHQSCPILCLFMRWGLMRRILLGIVNYSGNLMFTFTTHCLRKYKEKDSEDTMSSLEKKFCPFFDEVASCHFAISPQEDQVNFADLSKN